jgi:hypothetical protein
LAADAAEGTQVDHRRPLEILRYSARASNNAIVQNSENPVEPLHDFLVSPLGS